MYLVKYIKMDYDDRTQRIWQAISPSYACIAILESMAMSLLWALINLIIKQETSLKTYSTPLKLLNFTGNSKNMYRGGVRAGIYSKLFNFQKVVGRDYASVSPFQRETITGHTVSPPCSNGRVDMFIYPGYIRCKEKLRLYVSGAFCIQ